MTKDPLVKMEKISCLIVSRCKLLFSLSFPTPYVSPLVGKIIQKSHSLDAEIFSRSSSSQHNSVFFILCHPLVPIWFVYLSSSDKPII